MLAIVSCYICNAYTGTLMIILPVYTCGQLKVYAGEYTGKHWITY